MNDIGLIRDNPVNDSIGCWSNELKERLRKFRRTPSRLNIHNVRRSCRIGQSLLDLFTQELSPSCKRVSRTLTRTLRASREIRNADVLRKFLSQQEIDLSDRFPRKKRVKMLRRRIRKYWKNNIDSHVLCCEEISFHLREKNASLKIHPREEMDRTLNKLRKTYRLWSSGVEPDFSPVHDLRITLKMISGRVSVLETDPKCHLSMGDSEKKNLERVLRLLGQMSDLLMMEPLGRRLKGTRKARRLFMKKIERVRRLTDAKITRFLSKYSRSSSIHS